MAKQQAKAEVETEGIVAERKSKQQLRRLGVYDLTSPETPVLWHGEPLGSSWADDLTILSAIKRYNERAAARPGCTMAMAVFPY